VQGSPSEPVLKTQDGICGIDRPGRVILPKRNRKDVQADLPESVRSELNIAFASTIDEALEEVWGRDIWAAGVGGARGVKVEARL